MPRCPNCGARNPRENTTCRSCGAVLGLEPASAAPATDIVAAEAEQPVSAVGTRGVEVVPGGGEDTEGPAPEPDEETQNVQLGRAALFGVAAAAILGTIWYFLDDAFSYSTVLVFAIGWGTAMAAMFGAGRKRGPKLQWMALGITLLTVLVVRFLRDGLEDPASFFTTFWTWLQADVWSMMFVAVGLWTAYSTPRPRPKPPKQPEEPAESETAGEEGAAEGEGAEGAAAERASKEDPTRKCVRCQAYIPPGEALLVAGGMRRGTLLVCPNCVTELETRFRAETEDVKIGPAVAYGVGAALVIAVGWYLLGIYTRSSLVSIIGFGAGWILPEVLRFGAGRKRGRTLQYIAVGLTLAVIVGVNVALAATTPASFLRHVGFHTAGLPLAAAGVPLAHPIVVTPRPFLTNLMALFSDPMTDVIYLLALFQSYNGPAPRKLGGMREQAEGEAPDKAA